MVLFKIYEAGDFTIISRLSLLKQKMYCNEKIIVYSKIDKNIVEICPSIPLEYMVISNSEQLNKFSEDEGVKKNAIKLKYFIENKCTLYLAIHNNNAAGHYIVCKLSDFKPYLYLNNYLFNLDNNYYIFFCNTFDKYKRKGIFSYILTQICKDILKNENRIFISSDIRNISSQKAIEKVGFTRLGILNYVNLFPFVFINDFQK